VQRRLLTAVLAFVTCTATAAILSVALVDDGSVVDQLAQAAGTVIVLHNLLVNGHAPNKRMVSGSHRQRQSGRADAQTPASSVGAGRPCHS
jgi:hypothetical protein